ncbi:hypothetical protein OF829_01380 [Sphingomonas sp. LB-2]|uniref:hypothetical protein n=1 Tax=Sphingomonas caeni TaxID=2984949 RepID=UPI00222EB03C|nr:hypothetical protein [Sphingomonas caeni]MCW3845874.1 hypothetical protein [Sphingomonas caeni]
MLKPFLVSAAALTLLAAPAALIARGISGPDAVAEGEQHYVIHVPRITITTTTVVTRTRAAPAALPPPMVERKADDCLRMQRVVAFAVTERDSVDLMLNDGSRMRVKLGSNCPSLGFYSGFYVRPNPDGKMCAGRDSIRSRSGGSCEIKAFRNLVPAR